MSDFADSGPSSPTIQSMARSARRRFGSGWEAGKRVSFFILLVLIMLVPLGMVEGVIEELAPAVVMLDVTADWCLTCKVNERVAFGSDAVRASLRAHDVALLRADWTTRDPSVTRALAAFNRNSVPFAVLYGRNRAAAPAVLPTLLTPGIVTRALDAAAASRAATLSAAPAR